jgi:hypothetical protein
MPVFRPRGSIPTLRPVASPMRSAPVSRAYLLTNPTIPAIRPSPFNPPSAKSLTASHFRSVRRFSRYAARSLGSAGAPGSYSCPRASSSMRRFPGSKIRSGGPRAGGGNRRGRRCRRTDCRAETSARGGEGEAIRDTGNLRPRAISIALRPMRGSPTPRARS